MGKDACDSAVDSSEAVRPTSVGSLLRAFAEDTSMHGLGRVASSRFLWLRVLWALLVLTGAGMYRL